MNCIDINEGGDYIFLVMWGVRGGSYCKPNTFQILKSF